VDIDRVCDIDDEKSIEKNLDHIKSIIYDSGKRKHDRVNITQKGLSPFDKRDEPAIPILSELGFAGCINPLDIYLAFEEYFSMEKTVNERSESIGLTNDEKVENHGFNLKDSFRGKQQ